MYRYVFKVSTDAPKTKGAEYALKLSKLLNSSWLFWPVFFVGILVLYVFLAGVTLALIYANRRPTKAGFVHMYTALDVLNIDYLVVLGLLLLIYLVDTLVDIKKLRRGLVYFYWVDDPLLFRFEALFALFFFFAMVAGIVVFMHFKGVYAYSVALCFDFAYFFAMILFGNVIISVVEVYRWIVKMIKRSAGQKGENDQSSELRQLLSDQHFVELFGKYCRKELSIENLQVYSIIDQAKKKGKMEFSTFQSMFLGYIKSNSDFEVNIKSSIRNQVSSLYEGALATQESIDTSSLDDLYCDVIANLDDTFGRFSKTTQFELFVQEKEQLMEMFHVDDKTIPAIRKKTRRNPLKRDGSSLRSRDNSSTDTTPSTPKERTTTASTSIDIPTSDPHDPNSPLQ